MTTVRIGELAVHCRALGDTTGVGPTVVFVHGLGTDSLASFYLTLAGPVADAGIRVLSYDLRGHGRTTKPSSGYLLEDFVADLHGLLEHEGPDGPVHLVGNSFGGTIAFAYAAAHPARVASLVTIEAEPPTALWRDRMADVLGRTRDWFADEANFAWVGQHYSAHHERLARQAAVRVLGTSMTDEIPLSALLDERALADIDVPVLSIVGSDGYLSDDLHAVGRLLPRGRTVVIEDQDHSVLVDRHPEVRTLLLDWVAEHEGDVPCAS